MIAQSKWSLVTAGMALTSMSATALAQSCEPADIFPDRTTLGGLSTTGNALAVGDLNGDGLADLASAGNTGFVDVRLTSGGGSFEPLAPYEYAAGAQARGTGIALADFNNDGAADLAVSLGSAGQVAVFQNNGDGTFAERMLWPFGDRPEAIGATDIDDDGNIDLITATIVGISGDAEVVVRRGLGDGTFASQKRTALGDFPRAMSIGDLNSDGSPDAVVATLGGLEVFLNLGGALTPAGLFLGGSEFADVALGDVDGDGILDAVLSFATGENDLGVLLGDGAGGFGAPFFLSFSGNAGALAMADVDGDGDLDVVDAASRVQLWPGNGDGTFELPTAFASVRNRRDIALADIDQDGDPDVITTGESAIEIRPNQCIAFPPAISVQPERIQLVDAGTTVRLSVDIAFGTPPINFQWRRNGEPLSDGEAYSGTATRELTITPAASEHSDVYDVVVSNASGSVTSLEAIVAVRDACPVDFDDDGRLDLFDFLAFQQAFARGCE